MIGVDGYSNISQFRGKLTFDYYVMVRFNPDPLEAVRYVLIRTAPTNLLELKISIDSMVLRGFKVVLVDQVSLGIPLDLSDAKVIDDALPLLCLPDSSRLSESPDDVVEIKSDFSVAMVDELDVLDILIGSQRQVDTISTCGRVWFLASNRQFVGIRIIFLSEEEKRGIRDHIAKNASGTFWD